MTEHEWNESCEPRPMLEFLESQRMDIQRKLKLFVCACARRYCYFWHEAPEKAVIDALCQRHIETVEQIIDGEAESKDLESAWQSIQAPGLFFPSA